MKPPATDVHRKLREKLLRLCDSPVAGEAAAAKHKLERLLGKYDFNGKSAQDAAQAATADLFEQVRVPVSRGKARLLFSFEPAESDIASFAQWAIEKSYSVKACIRSQSDWRTSIWVNANAPAMPELQKVAATIRSQFVTLWETLRKKADVEPTDRRPFMLGLYDGMMDDPRQPGQMLPQRGFAAGKRRPKAKVKARKSDRAAPGLATHPYTLAVELGRQIRFCATVEQTTAALESCIAGALGDSGDSLN